MNRRLVATIATLLLLTTGLVLAQARLTPHEEPIRYIHRPPAQGTPQAAMVNLVLLREEGRIDEATRYISKTCPGWLRESMLSSDAAEYGPMKKETLTYQLREYTPERALVSVDYNTGNGTFKGWTRSVVSEDGRWVGR